MASNERLSPLDRRDIVDRFLADESAASLAGEYDIDRTYVYRLAKEDAARTGVVPQEARKKLLVLEKRLGELSDELERTQDEVSEVISALDPLPEEKPKKN